VTRKQQQFSMILVFTILALLALNSIFYAFQIDLTANQTHSLNPKTVQILQELDNPVKLTYYLSPIIKEVPPPRQNVQGIEDMLSRFADLSPNITYTQIDPDNLSAPDLQRVVNLGIASQGFQQQERSQMTMGEVFSGIVVDGNGKTEVLPFLAQANRLEYDLLSKILLLEQTEKPKMGILIGDFEQSYDQNFRLFTNEVGGLYELRTLNPGEVIASDLDLLLVAGNKDLSDADAYYINQFVMEGGRVFFALEGMAINSSGQGLPAFPLDNTAMIRLLTSYGINVRPEYLLDRVSKRITMGNDFRAFPLFTRTLGEMVDQEHPITSQFTGLDLFFASPLSIETPEGLEATVLTQSTELSWLAPNLVSFNPDQVEVSEYTASEFGPFPTSVALRGIIPSAFPGDPPPGVQGTGAVYQESAGENLMVVVGDSDFLTDIFIQLAWQGLPEIPHQGIGSSRHNIQFFANVIQFLGANPDLLEVKNKPFRSAALTAVTSDNVEGINTFLILLNVGIIPLAVLIGGLLFSVLRRRLQLQGAGQHSSKSRLNSQDLEGDQKSTGKGGQS
jgi:ABC-type uncharacterized transport system involved in gliding motility auxiliary subunit